jgi:predicted transcriptional regulator
MELVKRCCKFIAELGIPITVFCRKINISTQSFYDWKSGKLNLSANTLKRIENYIGKYGF